MWFRFLVVYFVSTVVVFHFQSRPVFADDVVPASEILKGLKAKAPSGEAPKKSAKELLDDLRASAQVEPDASTGTAQLQGLSAIDLKIFFDPNSSTIKNDSFAVLFNLGKALEDPSLANQKILIAGHTDAKGSDEHNLGLSQRRAEAVKQFIVAVQPKISDRLNVIGFGERDLLRKDDPESDENRRVQIVNLGE